MAEAHQRVEETEAAASANSSPGGCRLTGSPSLPALSSAAKVQFFLTSHEFASIELIGSLSFRGDSE